MKQRHAKVNDADDEYQLIRFFSQMNDCFLNDLTYIERKYQINMSNSDWKIFCFA